MFSDQFEEIAKGIVYSRETWRLMALDGYRAVFIGRHRNHVILFVDGERQCSCAAWQRQIDAGHAGWCRHTVALRRILIDMNEGRAVVRQAELVH